MSTSRTRSTRKPSPEPPRPTFTADDLAASLAEAIDRTSAPEGAMTTNEMVEATGWTESKVKTSLSRLFRASRLRGTRVLRPARDGTMRWTTAYEVLPAKDRAA